VDSTPEVSSDSTDFYNLFGSWNHRFNDTFDLSVAAGPTWVKADDSEGVVTVARDRRLYPLFSIDGETRLVKASSCPTEDGDLILPDCESSTGSHRGDQELESSQS
jgi:hypothetical protein